MTPTEISVVCSSYNRADRLPNLLAALEGQTLELSRFEVVVVNNGSNDDTERVLAEFCARTPLRLRSVSLPKNRGASGGRNAAWREAAAPIVAFTDDDCAPEPRWLDEGLAAMADAEVAVVVGQTLPNPAQSHNVNGPFSRTQRINEGSGTRFLQTCNIFYRRDDLLAVNGFDERFKTKGGEDTDMGWRVLDRGGRVAYAAEALVLHDISKGSFKGALREAITWRDIPLIAVLHPAKARSVFWHRIFWKKSHEYVLLAGAGFAAAAITRELLPLGCALPWLYYRIKKSPLTRDRVMRFVYLPHAFAIDAVEVSTMVRGSVKNRTFVL